MKNRISLEEVIAFNNTPKAKALVVRYGYEPAVSYEDLIQKLYRIKREYREEALEEMANLHPHKDLILHFNQPAPVEAHSNACGGYSKFSGQRYSNFEMADDYLDFTGKKSGQSKKDELKDYLPMIAIAGMFALAITAIGKKA